VRERSREIIGENGPIDDLLFNKCSLGLGVGRLNSRAEKSAHDVADALRNAALAIKTIESSGGSSKARKGYVSRTKKVDSKGREVPRVV